MRPRPSVGHRTHWVLAPVAGTSTTSCSGRRGGGSILEPPPLAYDASVGTPGIRPSRGDAYSALIANKNLAMSSISWAFSLGSASNTTSVPNSLFMNAGVS